MDKLISLIPVHELEQEAQQQIYREVARPFLKKLAIMPDCHAGYTLPIGGVALLDGVVSPEYVGYDIGCGMCCVVTEAGYKKIDADRLFDEIYRKVPVGFACRGKALDYPEFESASGWKNLTDKVNAKLNIQLGTLGSGNHFIEIGFTQDKKLAVTIHSGSRNIGHSIAGHYMKLSGKVDKHLPKGFLDVSSKDGQAYIKDMMFAQEYALANRKVMMIEVLKIIGADTDLSNMINENHNHLIITPDGILHRKGATPADEGQLGVIPGNMKSGVYITRGLGNQEYLSSASHGAGRKMSRKKAKENLDLKWFEKEMKGIKAKIDHSTLDEAPGAYKDLHKVIERQEGVVIEVVDYITPIVNIKG